MEFQILGRVRVVNAGNEVPLGGPRHRRVLAVLLVHSGEAVSTGRLTEAMWGDQVPRRATEMIHVRMSELRAALRRSGHDGPVSGGGGYRLPVGDGELDASEFERLAAAGSAALARGDLAAALEDLVRSNA